MLRKIAAPVLSIATAYIREPGDWMKRLKVLLIWMILVAIGAGASFALRSSDAPDGPGAHAAAAQPGMPPMSVAAVRMEEVPVQIWKEFPGRLEAVDIVELRP